MSERKAVILIVEDDADMARLNSRLLSRNGYEVFVAGSAVEARAIVRTATPDLFVVDVGLPDGSGLELCKEIRENSDAPLMFLTGRTSVADKISGLDSGGDYYLTKPYDKDEFIAVIQTLLRRVDTMQKRINESKIISKGTLTLKLDERKAFVRDMDARLSQKEFSLLLLLVQNDNKELTYEYLYESVWGAPMYNDSAALRQLISRMKKKLDEENAEDFSVVNEHGVGYTFMHF